MAGATTKLIVKWGKEKYTLEDVDLRKDVRFLKDDLQKLSGVHPDRQRILLKGRIIANGENLANIAGSRPIVLTMMGSNDVIEVPMSAVRFIEDMSDSEKQTELMRFMRDRHNLTMEERRMAENFIESIPGMPDFHTYDFSSVNSINIFRADLAKHNTEAVHLVSQAMRVEFACSSNDLDALKGVAITNYHPAYSPLALAASGLVRTSHPLTLAVNNGNIEMARYILDEGRVSIPTTSRIFRNRRELIPFLHAATAKNDIEMMKLLLAHHADPYEVAHKMCPVGVACLHGHLEAIDFLLEYRLDRSEVVCRRNMQDMGDKWLDLCAMNDAPDVARLLIGKYITRDFLLKNAGAAKSSIHTAAENFSLNFLRWAVEDHYIDPDVSPNCIATPLACLIAASARAPHSKKITDAAQYLIREGADKRRLSHVDPSHWLVPIIRKTSARALSLRRICYFKMRRENLEGLKEEAFQSSFPSERRDWDIDNDEGTVFSDEDNGS